MSITMQNHAGNLNNVRKQSIHYWTLVILQSSFALERAVQGDKSDVYHSSTQAKCWSSLKLSSCTWISWTNPRQKHLDNPQFTPQFQPFKPPPPQKKKKTFIRVHLQAWMTKLMRRIQMFSTTCIKEKDTAQSFTSRVSIAESINNTSSTRIITTYFNLDSISWQNPNKILAYLTRDITNN